MKISLLAVISCIMAVALHMIGDQVHAAPLSARAATTLTFTGTLTLWSNAPGFSSPKVEKLTTPVVFTPDATDSNWSISIAKLSIPWSSSIVITLQGNQAATGTFNASTNAVNLTLPLQGIPVLNTLDVTLTTDSTLTTTTNQTIHGSHVDTHGNLTLIGSKSVKIFFFKTYSTQISIQGILSPWPLPQRSN